MKSSIFRSLVCSAALAILLSACSARVELLAQVSEDQANDVLAALINRGISAEKQAGKEGLVSVRVAQTQVAEAIGIMRSQGLPHPAHARMGEVFKKEGLISSPLEERARMVYALSQELAGTISHIDGVITAEVHVVLPERAGFGEAGNASSAAVFIKHQDTVDMKPVVPQIRRLVANSISGLDYDKVSVVLVAAAPAAEAGGAPAEAAASANESVLGLEVASGSAGRLRLLLMALALAGLGGAASAALLWWRSRA
ncbi:type III secretion system inner membrane ring lipoprotein SctJ [Rugamonas aquatica]|uniref:Lipoprotein n=1 Tax=Rugamonas aquatica TaxID=2743357 RepID=A0A6A7N6P3_9BURK|nr:type III secretion inner membrane ring lipoprotein SctJ [Rugamonas aquatica]MQA40730.1 EscJ/YscJ/HrcJ family type III secretion inner membrane ring protein [Rugamonas aquatica]